MPPLRGVEEGAVVAGLDRLLGFAPLADVLEAGLGHEAAQPLAGELLDGDGGELLVVGDHEVAADAGAEVGLDPLAEVGEFLGALLRWVGGEQLEAFAPDLLRCVGEVELERIGDDLPAEADHRVAGDPVPVLGLGRFLDQGDGVGVREMQQMAGAVEGVAVLLEAAGEAAGLLGRLEQDRAAALALGLDSGAQSGRAGADDDDVEVCSRSCRLEASDE